MHSQRLNSRAPAYKILSATLWCLAIVGFAEAQTANQKFVDISNYYVDSTSIPGVHFILDGPSFVEDQRIVIGPTTRIMMVAARSGSQSNIEYKLDNKQPSKYLAPLSISEGGEHEVVVRSPDQPGPYHSISFTVDTQSPIITTSIVYKSITLKRFQVLETKAQKEMFRIECPVGSELHVVVTDNIFKSQKAFLKEGNAIFKIIDGAIELRSRGRHQYKIVASDLLGNTTESPQILLDIIER